MTNTLKRKSKQWFLIPVLLGVLGVAATLGGCAADKKGRTPQQEKQAETLIKNSAGYLNPTSTTVTPIEGTWLSPCVPGSFQNGAHSARKGYIFVGNSFYKQVDYFSSDNCDWEDDETLAQGRAYAKIAAGWFSTAPGTGGLTNINMLAAPNFGSQYEYNVYSVAGTGTDKILSMGDAETYGTRPTGTSIDFVHWDTANYAK